MYQFLSYVEWLVVYHVFSPANTSDDSFSLRTRKIFVFILRLLMLIFKDKPSFLAKRNRVIYEADLSTDSPC